MIELTVVPCAGKVKWTRNSQGHIKCFLKSPAQKGKANQELLKMIARALKLPLNQVELVQGATARKKLVKINANVSMGQFLMHLGMSGEEQHVIF